MKTEIHPEYGETTVTCSCGNTFTTRSTAKGEMRVELCNECHPFYTGKQKLVDTAGRVEKFQRRYAGASYVKQIEGAAPTSAEAEPVGEGASESSEAQE